MQSSMGDHVAGAPCKSPSKTPNSIIIIGFGCEWKPSGGKGVCIKHNRNLWKLQHFGCSLQMAYICLICVFRLETLRKPPETPRKPLRKPRTCSGPPNLNTSLRASHVGWLITFYSAPAQCSRVTTHWQRSSRVWLAQAVSYLRNLSPSLHTRPCKREGNSKHKP